MKKLAISLLTAALLPSFAFAQTNLPRSGVRDERQGERQVERQGERQGERDTRQEGRQDERQGKRDTRQEGRQDERQGTRDERQTGRQGERQGEREARQADRANRISDVRAAAAERIAAAKTKLQERLAGIRDEQKKRRVERIEERLTAINTQIVNRFNVALQKMSTVLDKISQGLDGKEAEGKASPEDIAAVRSLIANADSLITTAGQAVAAQAGKVYTVSDVIGAESTLQNDLKPIRDILHNDMQSVKASMEQARQAVHTAGKALSDLSISTAPSDL